MTLFPFPSPYDEEGPTAGKSSQLDEDVFGYISCFPHNFSFFSTPFTRAFFEGFSWPRRLSVGRFVEGVGVLTDPNS